MNKYNGIKNITIDYYKIYTYEHSENISNSLVKKDLKISVLLEKLKQLDVKKRSINYNGEYVTLNSINYNKNTKLWELVFFKGRYNFVPFIIDKNGNVRNLMLEKDEMISEILCVEYDPSINVLAVQRNIYAFGKKCLEDFFFSYLDYPCILEPIVTLKQEKKSFFKKGVVKKFKLHVKNTIDKNGEMPSYHKYNKNTALCKVIDSALSINSAIINIEFSVGNASNKITIQDEDFDVFDDLMENRNVKSLELGIAPDEYSNMQLTDFIDFRVRDTISLPFIKGQPIEIAKLLDQITEKFKQNMYLKDEIYEEV